MREKQQIVFKLRARTFLFFLCEMMETSSLQASKNVNQMKTLPVRLRRR